MAGWTDLFPRSVLRVGSITLTILLTTLVWGIFVLALHSTSPAGQAVAILSYIFGIIVPGTGISATIFLWIYAYGYVSAEQRARKQARAVRRDNLRAKRAEYRRCKEQGLPELPAHLSRIQSLERELGIGDWER